MLDWIELKDIWGIFLELKVKLVNNEYSKFNEIGQFRKVFVYRCVAINSTAELMTGFFKSIGLVDLLNVYAWLYLNELQ